MSGNIVIYIIVMAGVTYLIRMLPLVLAKKEITNVYVKSFLHYMPYACLAAMTFPAMIHSTTYVISGVVGLVVAIVTAYFERSLITVALLACVGVFVTEQVISLV